MHKVTAYIIPGFDYDSEAEGYNQIARMFRKYNVTATVVRIGWKQQTISSSAQKLLALSRHRSKPDCLFGFSLGAMVAFAAALQLKPEYLFLCSLSPYFKEDLSHLTLDDQLSLGKRRIQDFSKYSFRALSKHIHSKTFIFAGSEESSVLLKRAQIASHELLNAELIRVRKGIHSLLQANYQQAIDRVFQKEFGAKTTGKARKILHHNMLIR